MIIPGSSSFFLVSKHIRVSAVSFILGSQNTVHPPSSFSDGKTTFSNGTENINDSSVLNRGSHVNVHIFYKEKYATKYSSTEKSYANAS